MNKLKLVVFFLFLTWGVFCFSLDWKSSKDNSLALSFTTERRIPISLGPYCYMANQMKFYNIRPCSSPFDWIYIPFESLYELFGNDFSDFLDSENLVLRKVGVRDIKSKIIFPHDFNMEKVSGLVTTKFDVESSGNKKEFARVSETYARRVWRLHYFLSAGIPLYLMRIDLKKNEAIKLYNLLKSKYSKSDFILVSFQVMNNKVYKNWEDEGLINFHIGESRLNRSRAQKDKRFKKFFQKLGLI